MKMSQFVIYLTQIWAALLIFTYSGWTASPVISFDKSSPQQVDILSANNFDLTASVVDDNPVLFNWSFQSIPGALGGNPPQISVIPISTVTQRVQFSIDQEGQYILQLIVDDQDGDPTTVATKLMIIDAVLAQTFFVSNSGSDTVAIDQISQNNPLKTIDKAMSMAGAGDTIILLPDSVASPTPSTFFVNTINFTITGTDSNPLNIRGEGNKLITIKPLGSNVGFRIIDRTNINISNLKFEGFANAAISLTTASDIIIDSCEFHKNKIAISIADSTDTTIIANLIHHNDIGVQIDLSNHIAVRDNYVYQNDSYGYFQISKPQASINNQILNNTFYKNGTTYDENIQHAAINMGANPQNSIKYNLLVNNIKDYHQDSGVLQSELNTNLSFLNVGIQREESFLAGTSAANWDIVDPLLKDPENGDFRLIQGSPAVAKFFSLSGAPQNIGAYQGSLVQPISRRTIYVDYDEARNSSQQNGNFDRPYDKIDKALLLADPGDQILVKGSTLRNYTINFDNLSSQVPGWGQITIQGINKIDNNAIIRPSISCSQNGQNSMNLTSKQFIKIRNFVLTGYYNKNNFNDQCLNSLKINDSRHLAFEQIITHGAANAGVVIDSSENIQITSAIIFDNTAAMQLQSNSSRNQYNYFDKLTISENLNGVSIQESFGTTIINSIFYKNSNCITTDAGQPPTNFKIRYSLCQQTGTISNLFTEQNSFNKSGSGSAYNPLFVSEDRTYQKTNPWAAFRLSATGTSISPALNAGQPNYPSNLVLNEFPVPLSNSTPISTQKSVIGTIDMGAFEQSRTDVDGDGINNIIDATMGLDPNNSTDALADFDDDGLTNLFELSRNPPTSINNADTDGDGFSDGIEVGIGSDPTVDDADFIRAQIPKPYILPHQSDLPPGVFTLTGIEMNGRRVTNQWILLKAPLGITQSDIFINQTIQDLIIKALLPGEYEIGLDQTLIPTVSGAIPLGSLEADRSIVTITIQDVPPTPVLPPSITVSYQPGKVIYFYGSPDMQNPSFDSNSASITSYQWIPPSNSESNLIGLADSNPSFVVPNRSAVYQWKLMVSSDGIKGQQSTTSEEIFEIQIQGNKFSLPIAQAGIDAFVSTQNFNRLNGSGSGDLENSQLNYYWRQIHGPSVTFIDETNCPLKIFEPFSSSAAQTPCVSSKISSAEYFTAQAGVVKFELVVSKEAQNQQHFSKPAAVTHIVDSPINAVPQAVISAPDVAYIDETILLNGEGSSDRTPVEGNLFSINLKYKWQQVSGPPVFLSSTTLSTLELIPIYEGLYEFKLVVTDEQQVASKPQMAKIRVEKLDYQLPQADAGSNSTGLVYRTILLDASKSSGGRDPIQNYFWSQISGPELVNLSNNGTASTSFSPRKAGLYAFSLAVSTARFFSFADTVTIAVDSDTQFIPVAIPGNNQITTSSVITLDGSNSFDRDGEPLSYYWQQTSGYPVILSNPSASSTTFFAKIPGEYEFSLTVHDGTASSIPAKTTISIREIDEREDPPDSFVRFDPTFIPGPSSKSGCFIVSASFGRKSLITRYFTLLRDYILLNFPGGAALVELYYLYSPPYAELIQNDSDLRLLSKILLISFLFMSMLIPLMILRFIVRSMKNLFKQI